MVLLWAYYRRKMLLTLEAEQLLSTVKLRYLKELLKRSHIVNL